VTPQCAVCGEPVDVADRFCEACGAPVVGVPPLEVAQEQEAVSSGAARGVPRCPACTADSSAAPPAVTADGYCESCGRKVPSGRDHEELNIGLVAGVTDRGLRHARNEDAMALAVVTQAGDARELASPSGPGWPTVIAVISDGVSSTPRADAASLAVVQAAVRVLRAEIGARTHPADASVSAARVAGAALVAMTGADGTGPEGAPAATYASAVVDGGAVTACWLGDSRVYWLAADGSRCLTRDDSVAEELVASSLASREEAMASQQSHVITRWLGADLPDPEPHVVRFEPPAPGAALVCSDGLWNYQPEAEALAAMALPTALTDPLAAAAALVKFAVDSGGADNITAAIVPFPPAHGPYPAA